MQSTQAIELLRQRVTEAKLGLDKATATKEAKLAHHQRVHGFRSQKDSADRRISVENGTRGERDDAHREAREAEQAEREARDIYKSLRRELADAEKPDPLPVEQLERNLEALVEQDAALYAQMESQIVALQAIFREWNGHIDAKVAICRELRVRGERPPDSGLLGQADSRWSAWLTADFRDDAALHRQFTLMAHGTGYMNRLPTDYSKAVEDLRGDPR